MFLTIWELPIEIAPGELGLHQSLQVLVWIKEKCTHLDALFPPLQHSMLVIWFDTGVKAYLLLGKTEDVRDLP